MGALQFCGLIFWKGEAVYLDPVCPVLGRVSLACSPGEAPCSFRPSWWHLFWLR